MKSQKCRLLIAIVRSGYAHVGSGCTKSSTTKKTPKTWSSCEVALYRITSYTPHAVQQIQGLSQPSQFNKIAYASFARADKHLIGATTDVARSQDIK
ncbi:hypothetical protein DAPPUDRAFT_248912 [Daphnia pulex]|uniref:Uncharacterized protein n=1 Tax=Daphnia pulex TaxID=6669 RepID=E9GVG3_DAPPU|nr:hypothetical protein DAPPUDRAFT_248912 [Daphnia pulex]|eukprot:EFX76537.1 hypothetical protein DAPPUDRAFT_248912 [Daphnia pulex]